MAPQTSSRRDLKGPRGPRIFFSFSPGRSGARGISKRSSCRASRLFQKQQNGPRPSAKSVGTGGPKRRLPAGRTQNPSPPCGSPPSMHWSGIATARGLGRDLKAKGLPTAAKGAPRLHSTHFGPPISGGVRKMGRRPRSAALQSPGATLRGQGGEVPEQPQGPTTQGAAGAALRWRGRPRDGGRADGGTSPTPERHESDPSLGSQVGGRAAAQPPTPPQRRGRRKSHCGRGKAQN